MKDPDSLIEAIQSTIEREINHLGLDAEETAAVAGIRTQKVQGVCKRWFEYDEVVRLEIDTDAGTCTVVQIRG